MFAFYNCICDNLMFILKISNWVVNYQNSNENIEEMALYDCRKAWSIVEKADGMLRSLRGRLQFIEGPPG